MVSSDTSDTIHEPDDSVATRKVRFYVLELDGEVVAKYKDTEVVGMADRPPVHHGVIAPHPMLSTACRLDAGRTPSACATAALTRCELLEPRPV